MTDVRTVTLPDLGEGLTESDLVEWLVAVGDTVALNQVVAEVETAKALVQLPSPYAGVVAELLVEPGATVPVGGALLTIASDVPATGTADAPTPETADAPESDAQADDAAPVRTAVLVGYGPVVEGSARPHRRARSSGWLAAHPAPASNGGHRPGHAPVHPPVRKLAHDLGVDLDDLAGSGSGGRITREDVLGHAPHEAAAPRDVRIPVTGVRRQTAAAMVSSAFTAPHASTWLTVDVTPAVDLVAELRADRALADHHVTILTLAAKAVLLALTRNPALNARWDEDAIVQLGAVHLGIAAATERGLVVPVVKDADRMRLPALADAIRDLTDRARAGTTTPADLTGGTITITNVGVFGVDGGTPILVPGQSAILALGALRRQPWEHDGGIALRHVMTLTLSFDHRVVDGAEAARFVTDVGAVLARPGSVLAMV